MLQKPISHGFELISHVPISCADITINGSHAYLANGWDGFSILDISDIYSPSLLGKLDSPNYAWSLNVGNNIAYIAEHPGEYRYLVEESETPITHPSGVQLIDVSNLTKPIEIDRYLVTDFVDDVVVHNNHLFILANHDPEPFTCTLLIIRLEKGKPTIQIGSCPISRRGYQLVIFNNHVAVAAFDGLHVIDISNFNNPTETHHVGNHLSLQGFGIDCDSQNLYVASYFQGFRIFKMTNEALPLSISRTILWGIADSIAINGDTAYVSDTFYGLWRFDVTKPENPVETGFFPMEHTGFRKLVVAHSHIFVTAGHAGLFILRDTQGQLNLNINRKPGYTVIFDD